jgi:hypothetical protein
MQTAVTSSAQKSGSFSTLDELVPAQFLAVKRWTGHHCAFHQGSSSLKLLFSFWLVKP